MGGVGVEVFVGEALGLFLRHPAVTWKLSVRLPLSGSRHESHSEEGPRAQASTSAHLNNPD